MSNLLSRFFASIFLFGILYVSIYSIKILAILLIIIFYQAFYEFYEILKKSLKILKYWTSKIICYYIIMRFTLYALILFLFSIANAKDYIWKSDGMDRCLWRKSLVDFTFSSHDMDREI